MVTPPKRPVKADHMASGPPILPEPQVPGWIIGLNAFAACVGTVFAIRENHQLFFAGSAGETYFSRLFAHSIKYFMFERSSWPPSCCRQANSPSSNPVFTGGIFAVR